VAIFAKDDNNARGSNRGGGETTLSIISAGTTITGDIECGGVLKVEGRIDGAVRLAKQVMLAKDGAINGDVTAQEIVVGGVIDGNVSSGDRLELQPTAVVNGDITTKSIIVMEGARINGSVRMTELALVSRGADGRESRDARAGR
jgi:cytoskeletal protein CcmA (bactofilin family)